jgi:hypothetical protein
LLNFVEEKRVIPIVGPELAVVQTKSRVPETLSWGRLLALPLQTRAASRCMPDPQNDHRRGRGARFVNHPIRFDDDLANMGGIFLRHDATRTWKLRQHPSPLKNLPPHGFRCGAIVRRDVAHDCFQIGDRLVRPDYFSSHDGRSFSTSSCDFQRPSRTACRPFSNAANKASRSAASWSVAPSGKASMAACAASFTLILPRCGRILPSQGARTPLVAPNSLRPKTKPRSLSVARRSLKVER